MGTVPAWTLDHCDHSELALFYWTLYSFPEDKIISYHYFELYLCLLISTSLSNQYIKPMFLFWSGQNKIELNYV